MIKLYLAPLFCVIFLSACSIYHVTSEEVTADFYPSKQLASEVVQLEKVDKPHVVLGYVTVNTERRQRLSDVIEKMKREAAILGGDAITEIKTNASGTWKKLPGQELVGNAYVRANFTATVVVFK